MKRFTASAALALVLSFGLTERSDAAALLLDGVDDWVDLAAGATGVFPSGAADFTIGAWINPTSVPAGGGSGGQITFWGNQAGNQANGFRMQGTDSMVHYFWGNDHSAGGTGDLLSDTGGPNGDGWHHVAYSYDGGANTGTWFHNGAVVGTLNQARNAGVAVADANHRIGSRIGAEWYHGLIDELTVWGAALSPADVAGGWNLPIDYSNVGVQAALIAHYDFENGLGDVSPLGGLQDGVAMGGAGIDSGANAPLIPEPSSTLLSLLGLGLLFRRRR